MRELVKAGVPVGFCDGGGTPLFASNGVEVSWLVPQSEYRPTDYLQRWVRFWFDEDKRLIAAKAFQRIRLEQIKRHWLSAHIQREDKLEVNPAQLLALLDMASGALGHCHSSQNISAEEAKLARQLYKLAANTMSYGDFARAKHGSGADFANRFLDHGNYLAYSLGATTTWVLGLPHGPAVLHDKTRRGGLVFDVADLIKDALVPGFYRRHGRSAQAA
jgi:CRISPR-associated protein Cas1